MAPASASSSSDSDSGSSGSGSDSGAAPLPKVTYAFSAEGQADAAYRVGRLELTEGLSRLYNATVELAIEDLDADIEGLLGDSCVLSIHRGTLERRLCGIIERVAFRGVGGGHLQATVTVKPALAALGQRTNACIFQEMTAPDILKKVLEAGLDPLSRTVKLDLQREYIPREYCVQYGESDLDFARRLMAEESITFYFDHSGDAEELILVDDNQAFVDLETMDGNPVPIAGPEEGTLGTESVRRFDWFGELRPTSVVVKEYDWTRPRLQLKYESKGKDARSRERELFLHGGELSLAKYDSGNLAYGKDDGKDQAALVRETQKAREQQATGTGLVTGFLPGKVFELTGHRISKLDGKYVLTSVSHQGEAPEELLQAGGAQEKRGARPPPYVNRFECLPLDVPFRPERGNPKPVMSGPQTAIVVGPSGEEIFTDEHGRIKVQFHWDRLGGSNEKSSCFLRVVQSLAGAGFGAVYIPRIGMEVVVEFLHGDPDQPIVVGCVYNGANAAPYKLPDEKTKTVLRTNSSPGGDGYNELSFEDAAGSEQVYLQAQKDHKILVKNNKNQNVGGNETLKVSKNRSRTIDGNQDLTVGGDDTSTVQGKQTLTVTKDRETTVNGNRTETIAKNQATTVGQNQSITVGADAELTVGSNLTETITTARTERIGGEKMTLVGADKREVVGGAVGFVAGSDFSIMAGGDFTNTIGGGFKLKASKDAEVTIGKKMVVTVGEDFSASVGKKMHFSAKAESTYKAKKIVVEAEDELTLKVGSAEIIMKKSGDITLNGKKIEVKASGDIKLKGSKIAQN
jgi:type VI secretion system secreted protein VgrG